MVSCKTVVPNLFGTRDQFRGRQLLRQHLLLSGLILNRPLTNTSQWPGGLGTPAARDGVVQS